MNSEIILNIFIGLVIFNFVFTTVLDYINDKNWKDEIPDDLKDFYDTDSYVKAKKYKIERGRLSSISGLFNLVFTLCYYLSKTLSLGRIISPPGKFVS